MKKKLLIAMLALTIVFTGCGGSDNTETANKDQTVNTEVATSTESIEKETEQSIEVVLETEAVEDTEIVEATEVVESTESMDEMEVVEESTETESTEEAEEEAFTITAMSATKYAKSSVNVRKGPSSDYEKVGALTMNQEVKVTGQASTGWYRIELNGEEAFVSNNYLVDERIVVAQNNQTTNNNTGNGGSTSTTTPAPSPEQAPTTGIEPVNPTPTPEPAPTPTPSPAPETETAPRMITVYVDCYSYYLAEDDSGAWVEYYIGGASTVALEGTMVDPNCVRMASSDPNVTYVGDMFEAREGSRGILRAYHNYKRSER